MFVNAQPARGLLEVLQQIPDPRVRKGRRHSLPAMLAAFVCATLSGYLGFRPMLQWLMAQEVSFWHLLGFTRRPPGRKCYQDLLDRIDPELLFCVVDEFLKGSAVAESTTNAVSEDAASLDVEIWDGKTLRGTRHPHHRTQQLLVRFDRASGCILSSTAIGAQTNEAKAAHELLKTLLLKGKVIVADAAHCQRENCEEIVRQEGDYVVTVKDNQPQLHRDVQQAFVIPRSFSPLRPAAV